MKKAEALSGCRMAFLLMAKRHEHPRYLGANVREETLRQMKKAKRMTLLKKRLRFTFDFDVSIEDINRETFEEILSHYNNRQELIHDAQYWEEAQKQRRLLHEVLKDPQFTLEWMQATAIGMLSDLSERDIYGLLGLNIGDHEHIELEPFIGRLSSEDQAYFDVIEEHGVFSEGTEHLHDSFQANLVSADLQEIK